MGFRVRLALFLVLTLAAVQLLTAALVYEVTRRALIKEGERQLAQTAVAFVRQLDDVSERVAENVEVLVLDYALRAAIAQRDQATVLSALANHGRRIGAERMLLIGLDGAIEADTSAPEDAVEHPAFPFPELVAGAFERRTAAMVALDGKAYWMVVVPVYAPQPVALIAAGIPIDDALVARMQGLSALPKDIEISTGSGGRWSVLAHGQDPVALTERLTQGRPDLPEAPSLVDVGGREYVALAVRLDRAQGATPMAAVLGYSVDEALRPYRSVASSWAVLVALGAAAALLGALLIARGVSRPVEALAATARRITEGNYEASPPPVRQTGEIGHLSDAFASMTEAIREREQRIRHQAEHDQVTGLNNRLAAEHAIQAQLSAQPERPGALLMIGMARLPEVIKTVGHEVSDRMLRDAGERVRQLAGKELVARAGDTQLLLWQAGAGKAEAIAGAFRIVDALGVPYQEADLTLDLSPAVGVALHPEHGDDAGVLVRRADVALLAAQSAEEPVAVYEPATDPHRPERLALMGDLREALELGQLSLHYQPRLNLQNGEIDGAEGLVRWQHPRRGMIAPDQFIVLAEESGNIRRLTRWALAAGIAQAASWHAAGARLRVAINLSARDLEDQDLPRRIAELLAAHRVKPSQVALEITESAVMQKPDTAIAVLEHIAEQGVPIALDDFGVGQSSFAYLRRLPVREIKIDKSFVQQLADEAGDRTIVRSIVELGHRLGFHVTAEGVESPYALDYLAEIGCDHAQGYYIAEPLPPEALPAFLEHRCWRAASAPATAARVLS